MIGIDVLEIERVQKFVDDKRLLQRNFYEGEIDYFDKFVDPKERIAGHFCAKEAVLKALECPNDISVRDIEILHEHNGKPYVKLHNNAKRFNNLKFEISISHSKTVAVAICQILTM